MPVSTSIQSKAPVSLPSIAANSEQVTSGGGPQNKLDAGQLDARRLNAGLDKVADKVCWIEVKRYPYHPDHQVELLHLQAEADALLIKLQAAGQKQKAQKVAIN